MLGLMNRFFLRRFVMSMKRLGFGLGSRAIPVLVMVFFMFTLIPWQSAAADTYVVEKSETKQITLTPWGAWVQFKNGILMIFPMGCIDYNKTYQLTLQTAYVKDVETGDRTAFFNFSPHGLKFYLPVMMYIPSINLSQNPFDPSDYGLFYYDDNQNWELVGNIYEDIFNPDNYYAYIYHFSSYAIGLIVDGNSLTAQQKAATSKQSKPY
jgi:hypothetical protein